MLNCLVNPGSAEVAVLSPVQGRANTLTISAQNEENNRYCC